MQRFKNLGCQSQKHYYETGPEFITCDCSTFNILIYHVIKTMIHLLQFMEDGIFRLTLLLLERAQRIMK